MVSQDVIMVVKYITVHKCMIITHIHRHYILALVPLHTVTFIGPLVIISAKEKYKLLFNIRLVHN